MSDKKPIVIALILALLLIGGGWYFAKYGSQKAAILNPANPEKIITEAGIVLGNPDAPVTIEIYTNFLCPACGNFATQTFPKIRDAYVASGKVKFIFFIYPPLELSKAALCAVEQNKFAEYHDYLFTHQTQITGESDLENFAGNISMDTQKFSDCYASEKYDAKVQKWLDEGQAKKVDSTPTFFINGQKFVGAQPFEEFQKLIEQKLSQ